MTDGLDLKIADQELIDRLTRRAAANHRTIEAEHSAILSDALGMPPPVTAKKSFEQLSAELRAKTAGRTHTPSEVLLRISRDEAR
jgi:antitoxin FitA